MAEQVRTESKRTVNLRLVGLNGNAYSLFYAFKKQAQKEGWTEEEIAVVRDKAMSGDYNNLLCVLSDHTSGD